MRARHNSYACEKLCLVAVGVCFAGASERTKACKPLNSQLLTPADEHRCGWSFEETRRSLHHQKEIWRQTNTAGLPPIFPSAASGHICLSFASFLRAAADLLCLPREVPDGQGHSLWLGPGTILLRHHAAPARQPCRIHLSGRHSLRRTSRPH